MRLKGGLANTRYGVAGSGNTKTSHANTVTAWIAAKRCARPAASTGSTSTARHARAAIGDGRGERAGPCAELDDVIRGSDARVGRKASRERRALEEVLSEVPTVRPPRSCTPGHGAPSPLSWAVEDQSDTGRVQRIPA